MIERISPVPFVCYSPCSQVCLQSLQMQTTIVLSLTVLQSVHSVFFEPHFEQLDMVMHRVNFCCGDHLCLSIYIFHSSVR